MNTVLTFLTGLPRQLVIYTIAAILILLALAGGVWYIRHLGVEAEAQRQKIEKLEQDVKDANAIINTAGVQLAQYGELARGLEDQLATARQKQQELNGKLKNEIAKQPVYRECRVPTDGVRLLQQSQAAGRASPR